MAKQFKYLLQRKREDLISDPQSPYKCWVRCSSPPITSATGHPQQKLARETRPICELWVRLRGPASRNNVEEQWK